METKDYAAFISPKRRSVSTPKDLVKNGKAVFGTFDKEFENFNIEEPINVTLTEVTE